MTNVDFVLLVEDNDEDATLTKCVLLEAGLTNPVHVVSTADEALAYFSGVGKYADRISFPIPKVVFVDLKLPGKSGHEVLRWLSGREEFWHVLTVVLTGSDDPTDRKLAYELGANCYLEKPITSEQLIGPSRNLRMILGAGPTMSGAQEAPTV
jgi:CheY-like chemotaxis protein